MCRTDVAVLVQVHDGLRPRPSRPQVQWIESGGDGSGFPVIGVLDNSEQSQVTNLEVNFGGIMAHPQQLGVRLGVDTNANLRQKVGPRGRVYLKRGEVYTQRVNRVKKRGALQPNFSRWEKDTRHHLVVINPNCARLSTIT